MEAPIQARFKFAFLALSAGFVLSACEGGVSSVPRGQSSGSGSGGTSSGSGGSSSVVLPDGTPVSALMMARIRRLTNAEYAASAQALARSSQLPGQDFAPDLRQNGYTVNEAQVVDPVLAKQLASTASTLAAEVKGRVTELAPCADAVAGGEACATTFIQAWGAEAYRRPLDQAETDALLALYRVGADGATYADGIELVVRGLLQSAGFLYLTELGEPGATGPVIDLTPYELASQLSYGLTGGPPSAALVQAAVEGKLSTPEGRVEQAMALLGPSARARVVRMLREWTGVDRLSETAKDTNIYPQFAGLKASMEAETDNFIAEVMMTSANVKDLLGADFTVADAPLAAFYGVSGTGRVTVPNRRGLMNQGAFLSVYAHAHESAPVLRGVAVLRRIACLKMQSPTELNIQVVPPVPDPTKTTRERFDIHATDPECAQCHTSIDAFGFAFEGFDGMGNFRATDNGKPVDSTVTIALGTDFDGTYADSNELAVAMSQAASVRACFARNMFRATAGRGGESVQATEDQFVEFVKTIPSAEQGNVVDTLLAYVQSSLFAQRRTQ